MHDQPGITVTINRSSGGGFIARLPGTAEGVVESDSLDGLLDDLRGLLAAAVLTPDERDAECMKDASATPAGPAECWPGIRSKGRSTRARPLAEEIACYRRQLPGWGEHEGEHVLIKGGRGTRVLPHARRGTHRGLPAVRR